MMFTLNSPIKWIAGAIFTINMLASAAPAQDCETYDLYGAVTTGAGKVVPGALVEVLDVQTKELIKPKAGSKVVPKIITGSDGRYTLFILDLPNIQNGQDFILRVSKSGFITREEKINIYLCGFKEDVRMVRSKQLAKSKTKMKGSRKARRN